MEILLNILPSPLINLINEYATPILVSYSTTLNNLKWISYQIFEIED